MSRQFCRRAETPPTLLGAKTVTTDEVKALLGKVTILDVRRKASYVEGRIPGAKSIVGHFKSESKTFDSEAFGADKSAAIVIHGHGTDGWSAVYAVNSAVAAGYKDVRWMRGGAGPTGRPRSCQSNNSCAAAASPKLASLGTSSRRRCEFAWPTMRSIRFSFFVATACTSSEIYKSSFAEPKIKGKRDAYEEVQS